MIRIRLSNPGTQPSRWSVAYATVQMVERWKVVKSLMEGTGDLGRQPCCGVWGVLEVLGKGASEHFSVTGSYVLSPGPSNLPVICGLHWDNRGSVAWMWLETYILPSLPQWSTDKWHRPAFSLGIVSSHINEAHEYADTLLCTPSCLISTMKFNLPYS